MNGYITTKELAKKLGVDPSRVRRMILDGLILAEKAGRDNFITDAEVKRLESLDRKAGRPKKKTAWFALKPPDFSYLKTKKLPEFQSNKHQKFFQKEARKKPLLLLYLCATIAFIAIHISKAVGLRVIYKGGQVSIFKKIK